MSRLNDEFMEAYKHLDKICREMYQTDSGVTSYIEVMESNNGGQSKVPLWDATLRKLKKYRHIRNNYSHEVGTSYTDICTEEDVRWLKDFYDSIMNTTDPLAKYRKCTISRQRTASNARQFNYNGMSQISKKMDGEYQWNNEVYRSEKGDYLNAKDDLTFGKVILAVFAIVVMIGAIVFGLIQYMIY